MKANKKRIILSALSLVLVFCLLAGGTMAWFTDTEKVAGNFSAGILDIEVNPDPENGNFTTTKPMEFKNLRPMLLENFDKELVRYDAETETFADVNNLENNNQDPKNYGDNLPIYFRPVRVGDPGHPADLHSSWHECDGWQTTQSRCSMVTTSMRSTRISTRISRVANTLEDALKIFVYKKDGDTWTRLENINLNKETATSNEKICYDPTDIIGANEEVTYIIGGYLPSTAGNEYQGQHYHGALEVTAQQADLGPYPHNETGEDPAEFVVNVPVQIADQSDPSNPDYLTGVDYIPMTFEKGTSIASADEITRQLTEFLAKNLIEGKTMATLWNNSNPV